MIFSCKSTSKGVFCSHISKLACIEKMTERIFGNKTDFGIRYVSGWQSQDSKYYFGKLHLLLNGQIIGDKNESCLIVAWISRMQNILTLIENNSHRFYNPEFDKRTDEEIFELIYKSNQLPNEFNKDFIDLPVLSSEIWQYCNLSIDETTDAYLITMGRSCDLSPLF